MGRAHEVRKVAMAKTAAAKTKIYSRFGKEIYMAAKSGVVDITMNVNLKKKIEQAKANQVPNDVINRAIEKAKGSSNETYDTCRYEGFGPKDSTIIIDCLTDNVNRTISDIKTCFNKTKQKLGVLGSVSFNYENLGVLSFIYNNTNSDEIFEYLLDKNIELKDIILSDNTLTIYVFPNDLHLTQQVIQELLVDIEFIECELKMIPNELIELNQEDIQIFDKLIQLLEDIDDVQQIYHNVK